MSSKPADFSYLTPSNPCAINWSSVNLSACSAVANFILFSSIILSIILPLPLAPTLPALIAFKSSVNQIDWSAVLLRSNSLKYLSVPWYIILFLIGGRSTGCPSCNWFKAVFNLSLCSVRAAGVLLVLVLFFVNLLLEL